jgi:hypothetical protein
MKEISLTRGKTALVDDSDYIVLSVYKWHARFCPKSKKFYAVRMATENGKRIVYRMHWAIMGHKRIDHKDGNGLNNQRYNLRPANTLQNNRNRAKGIGKYSSQYKGVSLHACGKWSAQISLHNKQRYLGLFVLEIDAAKRYDQEATKEFGEFAKLNFPEMENIMAKIVKITVDENGDFTVDLNGFKGRGCDAIIKAFGEESTITKETHKREYGENERATNVQVTGR